MQRGSSQCAQDRLRSQGHGHPPAWRIRLIVGLATSALLGACGGGGSDPVPPPPVVAPTTYTCDDTLKSADLGDPLAKVILVKPVKKGEPLWFQSTVPPGTAQAPVDLCMVKLLVGPGNPGAITSPSTSAGIGIEIMLPTKQAWNERYVGYGNAGFAGGAAFQDIQKVSVLSQMALPSLADGYVVSNSDDGHTGPLDFFPPYSDWIMKPDGSPNWTLLQDWASRALHETAVKTKRIAKLYYGSEPKFSYWNGTSTAGREGLMLAQRYPKDFNGIISAVPAINWPTFAPSSVWPQIVMQQDLGGPITADKLKAVMAATINACDTQLTGDHDGYINDLSACNYDPTKDVTLLCASAGGTNTTATCFSAAEARAMNKIWYGPRVDGTMIDPALDNGWNPIGLAQGQIWYGYTRGTILHDDPFVFGVGVAGQNAFSVGADWLALTLENPGYATPMFTNELGKGQDLWRTMGYTGVLSFPSVVAKSQALFANLNATDNPDLSEFQKAGGKIIHWHGLADSQIPTGGSVHYYESVANHFGGYSATQQFYRFYLVPGMGHGLASDPTARPPVPGGNSNAPYGANFGLLPHLRDWVENGKAPDAIPASSSPVLGPVRERMWCLYPKKLKYVGNGAPTDKATSFTCN